MHPDLQLEQGYPEGPGPHPAVLLAPGAAYGKNAPLMDGLFHAALAAGFAAWRFNWRYYATGGQASGGLRQELQDLAALLASLRQDRRVDPARIVLAGKSLGSIVVHQVARSDGQVRGELLLTPVVRRPEGLERHYPGLGEPVRAVILVGDNDPGNCPLPVLYQALGGRRGVAVVVVAGDHGLATGEPGSEAPHVAAAVQAMVYWMQVLTGR